MAEALECLGGNGYVEDSGLPLLYREAPLNSVWEGSGNVNALDVLRALAREPEALGAWITEVGRARGGDARLDRAVDETLALLGDSGSMEVGARRLAGRMAACLQGSLLVRFAPAEVADAFCGSRLGTSYDGTYGTLSTPAADLRTIVGRTTPTCDGGEMSEPELPPVPPAVRAQLLAAEHWSLLATRSQTWSEVMSRIMAQFTFTSAVLVVLALVVQQQGSDGPFRTLALGLGAAVILTGTLTSMRLHYASHEDAGLVRGMNRLRRAYLDLDPGIEPYLITGTHDDAVGLMRTYTMGPNRSLTQLLASASLFITMVTALVAGGWVGILVSPLGTAVAIVLGLLGRTRLRRRLPLRGVSPLRALRQRAGRGPLSLPGRRRVRAVSTWLVVQASWLTRQPRSAASATTSGPAETRSWHPPERGPRTGPGLLPVLVRDQTETGSR